jgi:hypothetical protein
MAAEVGGVQSAAAWGEQRRLLSHLGSSLGDYSASTHPTHRKQNQQTGNGSKVASSRRPMSKCLAKVPARSVVTKCMGRQL